MLAEFITHILYIHFYQYCIVCASERNHNLDLFVKRCDQRMLEQHYINVKIMNIIFIRTSMNKIIIININKSICHVGQQVRGGVTTSVEMVQPA